MSKDPTKDKASIDYLGREFAMTRVFDAPRRLVFEAWTNPEMLAQWWGPKGFSNPVCRWPARAGAEIYVVMRGPDGTDYPMGGAFQEVAPPEKLVLTCGALDAEGSLLFEFRHTVVFVEKGPQQTEMQLRSKVTMTTPAASRYLGGFEEGMGQTLERLGDLAVDLAARAIVISREFDAPRELVWEAWTNPKHVVAWWGPLGFSTTIETMEFEVGGTWKHVMRGPDGSEYPNHSIFTEIVKLERIVYRHGGGKKGDKEVNFACAWFFEALGPRRSRLTVRHLFPTAEEREIVATRYGAVEGGRQTLGRLADYLGLVRAAKAAD